MKDCKFDLAYAGGYLVEGVGAGVGCVRLTKCVPICTASL